MVAFYFEVHLMLVFHSEVHQNGGSQAEENSAFGLLIFEECELEWVATEAQGSKFGC